MGMVQTRRGFLATVSAAGLPGVPPALADEGPPETTTVRLIRDPGCGAPTTLAEELVRAEGFTDVRYADFEVGVTDVQMLIKGTMDIGVAFAIDVVRELAAGTPITVLGGMHTGCQELFAHEPISNIKDLKGRSLAFPEQDYAVRLFLSAVVAYVGLDPKEDINWVTVPNPIELFAAGKVDAVYTFPPEVQELRSRKIGQVILRTTTDHPWSQYFCCVLVSRRDYVRSYPVATKRLLRAILKASDMCAAEPQWAAQRLVKDKSTARYDYALQMMSDLSYGKWREYDPEDTLRFNALRLHELGIIKSNPKQLIAEGTDWRFLNEIKRELKA
jgi:NitT/TauT family transport system substrate-binding protein